jgi:hypothetical protein
MPLQPISTFSWSEYPLWVCEECFEGGESSFHTKEVTFLTLFVFGWVIMLLAYNLGLIHLCLVFDFNVSITLD